MELANCLSIPILPLFVHFFQLSVLDEDDGELHRDDGTVGASLTEHTCLLATELRMMMLQGAQMLSVHLGLRRRSQLTGH